MTEFSHPDLAGGKWSIPFGKYKGKLPGDVLAEDEPYCLWFVDSVMNKKKKTERAHALAMVVFWQHKMLERKHGRRG